MCLGYRKFIVSTNDEFYELWQQEKDLKIIEINEAQPDILQCGIYAKNLTWIHSKNSEEVAEEHTLKISFNVTSFRQEYTKAVVWKEASHFEFEEKTMATEKKWSEFHNRGKTSAE